MQWLSEDFDTCFNNVLHNLMLFAPVAVIHLFSYRTLERDDDKRRRLIFDLIAETRVLCTQKTTHMLDGSILRHHMMSKRATTLIRLYIGPKAM